VGSVFSPYYARARRKGLGDPEDHCAINVALYGQTRRWAMTERGQKSTSRDADQFHVGASSMTWNGDVMSINIDEHCAPLPFRLRGEVSLTADQIYVAPVQLDGEGKHHWQAVAPHGRVHVELEHPQLSWSGTAYHDMNWGDEELEKGFKQWSWLRATTKRGTEVLYDVERNDGTRFSFRKCFNAGVIANRCVPPTLPLRKGFWGMSRNVASEKPPELLATLEDAPFYTRNHIALSLDGARCEAFHESLSLTRFSHPLVQLMLPFRMPRLA
jgi:carotenoid 1,2-hydratase